MSKTYPPFPRYKSWFFGLLLWAGLLPGIVCGMDFTATNQFFCAGNQQIHHELWMMASDVTVDGTANNDLFIAAKTAQFSGVFEDDLWCITEENVSLSGTARDHVRLLSLKTATVSGQVGNNLVLAASTAKITSEAEVTGDVLVTGENAILAGSIYGQTRIIASQVTLSGVFQGSVRIIADDIVIQPDTRIDGDLVYTSDQELFPGDRVQIAGNLVRSTFTEEPTKPVFEVWKDRLVWQFVLLMGALVAGSVWTSLFPSGTERALVALHLSIGRCALTGLVACCLIPLLILFSLFTLIGTPLGVLMLCGYIILLYLAKIVLALHIGGRLLRRRQTQPAPSRTLGTMALGLLVLYLLSSLPMIGFSITVLITVIGVGALINGTALARVAAMQPPAPPSQNGNSEEPKQPE
jgi:cytoskeletal protein CcmA (bactofilin family)